VDDIADGLLRVLDTGRIGEAYLVAGDNRTFGEALEIAAHLGGRSLPNRHVSDRVIRALAPFGPIVGPAMGLRKNLHEVVRGIIGVTHYASSEKARRELGYAPRSHRGWPVGDVRALIRQIAFLCVGGEPSSISTRRVVGPCFYRSFEPVPRALPWS